MLNMETVRTSWTSRLKKFGIASGLAFLLIAVFFALPVDHLLATGVNGVVKTEAIPYNLFEHIKWDHKGFHAAVIGIQSLFAK